MDEMNIGLVILDLRRKRGMTQEQLAEAVGVSPPAVSKWETGASCPDVALLAPIARALETDVNTLLSFHERLPAEELPRVLKEISRLAESDGPTAMARILALTRRYPTDPQLRFQLSSIAMGLPQLYGWPGETREAAKDFAEEGFEYVRKNGEKQLWPTATYLLAALLMERDKLDRARELLDSLPVLPMAPQTLYAALYQKQGQPERAWEQARMQLISGGQTVLQSLAVLAASDAPDAGRALDAYGAVAEALGYPPCLLNIQMAARAMEREAPAEALEKLTLVVRELKGETERMQPLWGRDASPDSSYYRMLGRMLQNNLDRDSKFAALRNDARFVELLRRLDLET